MHRLFVSLLLLGLIACGGMESTADNANKPSAAEQVETPPPPAKVAPAQPVAPSISRSDIVGDTWVLKAATDLSTGQLLPPNSLPAGFSVTFKENGEFVNFDGQKAATGKWALRGSNIIDVTLDTGDNPMYIQSFEGDELTMEFALQGKDWQFVFARVSQ